MPSIYADSCFNYATETPTDPKRRFFAESIPEAREQRRAIRQYIGLKLASRGIEAPDVDPEFLNVAQDLLTNYRATSVLLRNKLVAADERIQQFVDRHFADYIAEGTVKPIKLPSRTFTLDRAYMARELSMPPGKDVYESPGGHVRTTRIRQGLVSNPMNDKRTTSKVFHVSEGGLPIPGDKIAVPEHVFGNLLHHALCPPSELLEVPYTSELPEDKRARMWASLLLRPLVVPGVPGYVPEQRHEVRYFAPASLVANLDFVECVFGNGGDPALPMNDAALDPKHWTGTTSLVVLCPHLRTVTKKEVGLPHYDDANDYQRENGLCWRDEAELYHNGSPFHLTHRTMEGISITLIADSYFGYSKKNVKAQISFAANLIGLAEEEHAGGAISYPCYSWAEEFVADSRITSNATMQDTLKLLKGRIEFDEEKGVATDKVFPDIIYVPEHSRASVKTMTVTFTGLNGEEKSIKLLQGKRYVLPSGYCISLEKRPHVPAGAGARPWHIVGVAPTYTMCHKPASVSGSGKSEISKSIHDAIESGIFYVSDLEACLDKVQEILDHDYSVRHKDEFEPPKPYSSRAILSPERSLGSVIKLLTHHSEYTDEYNKWISTINPNIKSLVYLLKSAYKEEWGSDWRSHFSVDIVNGHQAHELKLDGVKVLTNYLRVGVGKNKQSRTFKLRQDFYPSFKHQMEDDITASIVVPVSALPEGARGSHIKFRQENGDSVKLVSNCEASFFQRPDDSKFPGADEGCERDMSNLNGLLFCSNFEPLPAQHARDLADDVVALSDYTKPVRKLVRIVAGDEVDPIGSSDERMNETISHYVCPSEHRVIRDGDGNVIRRSNNPRYLQTRPEYIDPKPRYVMEVMSRLADRIPLDTPFIAPVTTTCPGRRLNPPDSIDGVPIRPLCVFSPIHYQELPELFMDLIPCITGRSPSTTGAGVEGALTKSPFNMLCTTADLNNALVSMILTGEPIMTSAAGYVGPYFKVDHDISLLVPEIFGRMTDDERSIKHLIENGFLEKIEDFDHKGEMIMASRLGYRITHRFVVHFLGRIFDTPGVVFPEEMLQPEKQDLDVFVDGVKNICEAQKKVAQMYLNDGSISDACPPLKALIYIMATGKFEGRDISHPEIRKLFTRENLLSSDWYRTRLSIKVNRDKKLWTRNVQYLSHYRQVYGDQVPGVDIVSRLHEAREIQNKVNDRDYQATLQGTLGADWVSGFF